MLSFEDMKKLDRSLTELKQKHQNLDSAISSLRTHSRLNDFEEHRLKKEKLRVKDAIVKLQGILRPNIIA